MSANKSTYFAGQPIAVDTSPTTDRRGDILVWLHDYLVSLSNVCGNGSNHQSISPTNLQSLLDPAIAMADMAIKAGTGVAVFALAFWPCAVALLQGAGGAV